MKVALDITNLHQLSKKRGIGFYVKYLFDSIRKYTNCEVKLVEDGKRQGFEIIHFPYFDFYSRSLHIQKGIPTVVTVHDVIPLVFPKHYPSGIKGKINLGFQSYELSKASAVITDSISSKEDIIKHLWVKPGRIFPVYLAVRDGFRKVKDKAILQRVSDKYQLREEFVLYTGNVNWNKNLPNLAEACINAEIELVLTGGGFENRENLNHPELKSFKEFLDKYSDNRLIRILGFVPDEDLVALMNSAVCLLLPSFYEGFGLTILEAQACGLPVITSKISSMPEVGGKGACYIDPYKLSEISEAITKIRKDRNYMEELRQKGFENLERFSWEETALKTIEVYKKVLENA